MIYNIVISVMIQSMAQMNLKKHHFKATCPACYPLYISIYVTACAAGFCHVWRQAANGDEQGVVHDALTSDRHLAGRIRTTNCTIFVKAMNGQSQ